MGKHGSDSDSDSGSGGGSDDEYKKHKKHSKKDKKDKKDKKRKDDDKYGWNEHQNALTPSASSMPQFPLAPLAPTPVHQPNFNRDNALSPPGHVVAPRPPSRQAQAPPSGFRIPLTSDAPFPPPQQAGQPPSYDLDGVTPTFFGSALFPNSVHPCKIVPSMGSPCRVPYGGTEWEHNGRYDLLPYRPDTMELVPASEGKIPYGRRPVEGGYEDDGAKLYHALAVVNGVRVPGKTGEHLVRHTLRNIS